MRDDTFADRALRFYKTLGRPIIPGGTGVSALYPHDSRQVLRYTQRFLDMYFRDTKIRVFVFGINPGRFGSGATGVTFTDPINLTNVCHIDNTLEQRQELSSQFIYKVIELWGGPLAFYQRFFLTAVSPVGFRRNGVNYNYYDDAQLLASLRPFILTTLRRQLDLGARRDVAIVLGTGKNYRFMVSLNEEYHLFDKVYAVEHPRYIMQYRRRELAKYLRKYEEVFLRALG
jgi:hypothetical protein